MQGGSKRKIMNASTIRNSARIPGGNGTRRRLPLRVRCASLFPALLLGAFSPAVLAQSSCPGIHVKILDIKNSTGAVACALFESPDGFPNEYLRSATRIMFIKVRDRQARCDFEDIPPGTYALAVVHDENLNGQIDANWMKVPKEGYGFSNDAKAVFGPPSFSAASFPYDGQNLELTISLNY